MPFFFFSFPVKRLTSGEKRGNYLFFFFEGEREGGLISSNESVPSLRAIPLPPSLRGVLQELPTTLLFFFLCVCVFSLVNICLT